MSKKPADQEQQSESVAGDTNEKITCGIIMPISGSNETYTSKHWEDVRAIIDEVVEDAGFFPQIVSDANEVGIIHNRIVGNIYQNEIVICDVSSKNPNVMFELGLRLAFDKATIIIKDTATNYNFDTSPIEHLEYPQDLRYTEINKFKGNLRKKLVATYTASKNPDYSTFLKNFVQWKPKLEEKEIGGFELLTKRLDSLTIAVENMTASQARTNEIGKKSFSNILLNPLSLDLPSLEDLKKDYVRKKFYTFLKSEVNRRLSRKGAITTFLNELERENASIFEELNIDELLPYLGRLFDNAA